MDIEEFKTRSESYLSLIGLGDWKLMFSHDGDAQILNRTVQVQPDPKLLYWIAFGMVSGIRGYTAIPVKEIWLSVPYLKSEELMMVDTLAHEAAHALSGPQHGHDEEWEVNALKLGAVPSANSADERRLKMPQVFPSTEAAFDFIMHKGREYNASKGQEGMASRLTIREV